MKIGITELIVIFVVALLVIGPDKLPAYAQKLGQAMAQFRKYSAEATEEIKASVVSLPRSTLRTAPHNLYAHILR